MTDRIGEQLGNYRLIKLLGQGGFAEVYLGEHIHLGTQAAIKVLHTQLAPDDLEGFRIEARTVARLEHPNIVRVLEFGIEARMPFLVMNYAPNGSLRHPKGIPLPLPTIVSYVRQVADALQHAHDEKVIHRDVKPENILVGRRNEVLLSDFGIALIVQSTSSQSKQDVTGTIPYMAPEQIRGKPRPASDQYALGIVIYEWLCGYRPFYGSFTEIATQHMFEPPPALREKNPTILPAIEQAVMTALAKEPHQRFANVQTFATALEQACFPVQHLPIGSPSQPLEPTIAAIPPTQQIRPAIQAASLSRPPEPAVISTPSIQDEQTKPGISRRMVLAGLGALTGVGLVGSIAWLVRSQSSQTPPVSFSSHQTPTHHSTPTAPPSSGSVLWTASTGGRVLSSPEVVGGVVYVGSDDGKLYAFNASNGATVWSALTGNRLSSSPAVVGGVVYVGSWDSKLYAFNAKTSLADKFNVA